ncbi:hypothetical protein GW916_13720, partial [bacterium]|nr:hypothetical protein [bacterium]
MTTGLWDVEIHSPNSETNLMIFFALLLIFGASLNTYADNFQCDSKDPRTRANECLIPKTNSEIRTCCDTQGAAFCGEGGCACYRRSAATFRIAQGSGLNYCSLARVNEDPKNSWESFLANVNAVSKAYPDQISREECKGFLFQLRTLQEIQSRLPESRIRSSNVYLDKLI